MDYNFRLLSKSELYGMCDAETAQKIERLLNGGTVFLALDIISDLHGKNGDRLSIQGTEDFNKEYVVVDSKIAIGGVIATADGIKPAPPKSFLSVICADSAGGKFNGISLEGWRENPFMVDFVNRFQAKLDSIFPQVYFGQVATSEKSVEDFIPEVKSEDFVRTEMRGFRETRDTATPLEVKSYDIVKRVFDANQKVMRRAALQIGREMSPREVAQYLEEQGVHNDHKYSEMSNAEREECAALIIARFYRGFEIKLASSNDTVKMFGGQVVRGIAREI